MRKLFLLKMLRDMKRSKMTYLLCLVIVAVGFCGYSVLELCYENLLQSKAVFFRQAEFCDGFVECVGGTAGVYKNLERVEGISQAQARLVKDVGADKIQRADGRTENVREEDVKLHLVSWEEGQMNRPVLSRGSYPEKGKRQMVIGEGIAAARSLKPGDQMILLIGGNQVSMEITGVGMTPENIYMIRDMSEMLPNTACYDAAFTSFETMEALFRMEGQANSFLLRLDRGTAWDAVKDQVEQVMEPYGRTAHYGSEDQLGVSMIGEEIRQLDRMSQVVPFLFLAVAGVILYISLSRLMEQQRVQMGILMALGIPSGKIRLHYMWYGGGIGLSGGFLGGISGYLFAGPMAGFYRMYFNLPEAAAPLSWSYLFLGTMAAGLFCGGISWMIAGRISGLSPAFALRPAAPENVKPLVIERLPGFLLMFTSQGIMAVRSLSRNRRRAVLSVLGMAFAFMITATLVSMYSMFDVFIFDYWEKTQRQDLMVQFAVPVPKQDAMEAVRSEDVELAEGILGFPAVLAGPEGKIDCSVWALEPSSRLCVLYRADGSRADVKQEGIVLSEHMAKTMGVRTGDLVDVKLSDREGEASRIPVTDVIAQYMGGTAYMSLEGAAKAGSIGGYNMVLLKAPARVQEEIRDRLDDAGAVSLIESRQGRVGQYRAMMGSMNAVMASMTVMGGLISFAVIYISALIRFEELKRELATLMMLGMTSRECLEVISVGQWILALCAVVLGVPMAMGVGRIMSETMSSKLYTIPDIINGAALLQAAVLTGAAVWFGSAVLHRKLKKLIPADLLRERE